MDDALRVTRATWTVCRHLADMRLLRADHAPLVRSSDLGDAFMTSASWEEVEGFTWPYKRHFGQVPETSFSLPAQVVNDKGRSHQQPRFPFLKGGRTWVPTRLIGAELPRGRNSGGG